MQSQVLIAALPKRTGLIYIVVHADDQPSLSTFNFSWKDPKSTTLFNLSLKYFLTNAKEFPDRMLPNYKINCLDRNSNLAFLEIVVILFKGKLESGEYFFLTHFLFSSTTFLFPTTLPQSCG